MTRKIALDWDDQQLRIVVGEPSGLETRITEAAIVPMDAAGPAATLKQWVKSRGLEKTETLVAVGRDQAELRQMTFPPVPIDELPDIVRFQAIRQFASAGDVATVDYLPTGGSVSGDGSTRSVSAIVSASGPNQLDPVRRVVTDAGLTVGRIALRPVAAAALYQLAVMPGVADATRATTAVIDLVGDEAEIVLFRGRDVSFVRSVRLPESGAPRVQSLAGELRRSLIACGAGGGPCQIVLWGTSGRHRGELDALVEKLGEQVDREQANLIDPFSLVRVEGDVLRDVGETVGRLAPLVGVLVADEGFSDRLIDFANPRKRPEPTDPFRKRALLVAAPLLLVFLVGGLAWQQMGSLDDQIELLESSNKSLRDNVEGAQQSIQRTARVDAYLDGDVVWLEELQRLAEAMPPADQLILRQLSAVADPRQGGGRLTVSGVVTSPQVIEEMESALRDEEHRVIGDGASQIDTSDAYGWRIRETMLIDAQAVRRRRYTRLENSLSQTAPADSVSPEATAVAEPQSEDSQ